MFHIRLADIVFRIDNTYNYIEEMCRDYMCEDEAQVSLSVTEEEIRKEQGDSVYDAGYLESLAIYRKIAESLIAYDGFLLHGAVIDVEGCGVAFLAKSGVGKSTHMAFWQECLQGKATVINGDKPLIRIIDGKVYAYGTPWAGKEHLHTNGRVLLKKICFIERAEENICTELAKNEVLEKILPQVYRPKDGLKFAATMQLLEKVILGADFYRVQCTPHISAAEQAIAKVLESDLEKQLRQNKAYSTKTLGDSMYPMLQTGDRVLVVPVTRPLQKYDIPVYRRDGHFTMHRIVKVTKSGYIICGDNRTHLEKDITDEKIVGVLGGFYHGNAFISADSDVCRRYGKKAVKSYFYRKIKGKLKRLFR